MPDLIGHPHQSKTPCCLMAAWGLPLIIQQAVRPPALDIIDLLYIRRPHLYGLFQCNLISRSAWEFSEHTATQCRMPYEILYSETSSSSGRMVPTFHL